MQESEKITEYFAQAAASGQEPDFFWLIRLLENQNRDLPRIGYAGAPALEPVRFGQIPALSYNDRKIHSITKSAPAGQEVLNITVTFFGLSGPNGPLPLEITDYIYHRSLNNTDPVIRRFLDIINHRFLTLYCRAFSMYEVSMAFDRKNSVLLNTFLSLNHLVSRIKTALPPSAPLSRSVIMIRESRGKNGLESLLKNHFGNRIRVRDFIEKSHPIPREVRMKLGDPDTSVLGLNAQIGTRYRTITQDLCIEIGPLSYRESFLYMPDSQYFREMHELIGMYLKKHLSVSLELHIDSGTIPGLRLDGSRALGLGAHLRSRPVPGTMSLVSINMTALLERSRIARDTPVNAAPDDSEHQTRSA